MKFIQISTGNHLSQTTASIVNYPICAYGHTSDIYATTPVGVGVQT